MTNQPPRRDEYFTTIESPIGRLLLIGDHQSLTGLYMDEAHDYADQRSSRTEDADKFGAAIEQLEDYFAGNSNGFDLALAPAGTDFQRAVWDALTTIPHGETRSYGQIAAQIGRPKAARAVGMANNRNPIAVVIPCHRVIGADGSMVGYAGGLDRKNWLLDHERRLAAA